MTSLRTRLHPLGQTDFADLVSRMRSAQIHAACGFGRPGEARDLEAEVDKVLAGAGRPPALPVDFEGFADLDSESDHDGFEEEAA